MLIYKVMGKILPETEWEDFWSDDESLPKVSIGSDAPEKLLSGCDIRVELADDGWYDGYVREFTVESARHVLAQVNGIAPEEIEIIQLGACQSV